MRTASVLGLALALAATCAAPVRAQAAPDEGADQVVGLFGATCLHFAGDAAALRAFLQQQSAPQMPAAARDAFLAGRPGEVYDVSYQTTRLALVSLNDGGCEAVAEHADPAQVVSLLDQQAQQNGVTLAPLGGQGNVKGRPGVQQTAYGVTLGGRPMHVLVSTAAAAPQAVLSLVPR
jgi:hypothetical protein